MASLECIFCARDSKVIPLLYIQQIGGTVAMAVLVKLLLILLGIETSQQSTIHPTQILPPTNFVAKVTGLAKVLLSWSPTSDVNQMEDYEVEILTLPKDEFETNYTRASCTALLCNGFSARIRTIHTHKDSEIKSEWVTTELPALPGAAGTSITNLSCIIYATIENKTCLHCTWLAGQEVPEDTQYFIFYRYEDNTEECQEYIKDQMGRNTGCQFSTKYIEINSLPLDVIIHVNGSSNNATIKPFDQIFQQNHIEKVNPPRSARASVEQGCLLVKWEKPVSTLRKQCFVYEIKIHNWKTDGQTVFQVSSNHFRFKIDTSQKHAIQIRANYDYLCREHAIWSDWTETLYTESDELISVEWSVTLVIVAICSSILLLVIVGRKIPQLWAWIFPPIPVPQRRIIEELLIAKAEMDSISE